MRLTGASCGDVDIAAADVADDAVAADATADELSELDLAALVDDCALVRVRARLGSATQDDEWV